MQTGLGKYGSFQGGKSLRDWGRFLEMELSEPILPPKVNTKYPLNSLSRSSRSTPVMWEINVLMWNLTFISSSGWYELAILTKCFRRLSFSFGIFFNVLLSLLTPARDLSQGPGPACIASE